MAQAPAPEISVRTTSELHRRIMKYAEGLGLTKSEAVRLIVDEAVEGPPSPKMLERADLLRRIGRHNRR